ncbi:NADPH-dependent FMN reductase [Marinobacter sp. AL4B]|uniref:NADPH-dependent FMN reductase n=1 Tax=Marinobacter sp. AL4B TaxID=2871173 RepID=UPI001CAA7056|nr:NAD(P)H-dependent oxidoreductase [Marinobacter sp. AL4B]MBZ0333017.1 NAD(P)H-dependent oxidoreductase [Marinobacter sp. AL4B]
MKIKIVSSSQNKPSSSFELSKLLKEYIENNIDNNFEIGILNLVDLGLPFWDFSACSEQYSNGVEEEIDAFIFVVPDWNGMMPPILKNWFYFVGSAQFYHKPVLLCGVSSGEGGHYPLVELRAFAAKNFRMNFIPENLIFKNVKELLSTKTIKENKLRERINHCTRTLVAYSKALKSVRSELGEPSSTIKYGI